MDTILEAPRLYIPPGARTLDSIVDVPQIRLGIQGAPGEGKTFSALTFPNCIVLNVDRGLGAHAGRKDVVEIPIYDIEFIKKLHPKNPNKRDAILEWMKKEATKLSKEQTLIMDSGTSIESAFDMQERLEPVTSSTGVTDTYAFWRHKLEYFDELFDILFALRCNIVWCSHEQVDRDKKGELNGKLKPLLSGQYADKIVGKFTDWFRQHASDKPKNIEEDIKPNILKAHGMTQKEYREWCNSFPRNTLYYWETESSDIFSGKCSSLVNFPQYIPAHYDSFIKYRRKMI